MLESQIEDLLLAGVVRDNIYQDVVSSRREERSGLVACLGFVRHGDVLIVPKLKHLGENLRCLVITVQDLAGRGVGLKTLSGQGVSIDTTSSTGKLVLDIFAELAEIEREPVSKKEITELSTTNFYDRRKGRKYSLSEVQIKVVQSALTKRSTNVSELCSELKITRQTLYRYFAPNGTLRPYGEYVLARIGREQAGCANRGTGRHRKLS